MEVSMRTVLVVLLLSVPLSLVADDPHSHHQHGAPDLGNIGRAHIETSCAEAAQKEIDRGVALIHSFWYGEAEKAFRAAAAADETCGMAWWGVAMSNLHPIWAPPTADELRIGSEAAGKAKAVGAKTDREKAFIGAIHTFYSGADKVDHRTRMVAYEKAMAELAGAYPKDREAAIFHALALLGVADLKDKTYAQQRRAAAILNRVLPEEPEHPGVTHYLIHSFDYPELAELALPAARVYAKLAPGSPHALHMPSHIFTRLGLWEESIASNLASRDKAANYVAKVMPGAAAFDELHAIDYLVYGYLQLGKLDEAKKLVDRVAAVKKIDSPNHFAAAYAIGAVPGRYALERREWKEAAALTVPSVIDWSKVPYAEANIHYARAIGAARSGDLAVARDAVGRLEAIRKMLDGYWQGQVEMQRLATSAWLAHAEKKNDEALKLARAAVELEAASEKHPVTPGAIVPARELLAELLFELGKPEEALAEVRRVLKDAPGRRNATWLAARAEGGTR
jgi:tetratricopeptide (TPR) repeat protein